MAAVAHHFQCEIDGMADVTHAGDPTRPQRRALHHAGIQLNLTVGVEAGANAGVQ